MPESQANGTGQACPICGSPRLKLFLEMLSVPIWCNVLWPSQEDAQRCPAGDIRLMFCRDCGVIFNAAFEPSRMEYTPAYENSLHFSPRFQDYARSLAERLVKRHGLYRKSIISIGCGRGDFLHMLCALGDNLGFGFDPGYSPAFMVQQSSENVQFIGDYYSERYAHCRGDFFVTRHTLEHIHDPLHFLGTIRRSIGERSNAVLFIEVPNAGFVFHNLSVWDIIYEHCIYYYADPLTTLVSAAGFDVVEVTDAFHGQSLQATATPRQERLAPGRPRPEAIERIADDVASFAAKYQDRTMALRHLSQELTARHARLVLWGAGSKGVMLLNTLHIRQQVQYVVDINPRKQGRYVAGTAQSIVSPESLRTVQPDVVLVTNSVYEDEIRQAMHDLGLRAELICV